MATTLSRVPEACGLARFRNEAMSTTTTTAPTAIRTIFTGGRFFLAVPNSSPMLMVGPVGSVGVAGTGGVSGGGAGDWSGIGFVFRHFTLALRRNRRQRFQLISDALA